MLADDILELIKVLADIPENTSFDQSFMPSVYESLKQFFSAVQT